MNGDLPLLVLSLTVLLAAVLAQTPVQIQFQTDPVLVQTGTEIVFTVLTVPDVLSITWNYPGGGALGLWAGGSAVVNDIPQYRGRVIITATQLRIGAAQRRDAGKYSAEVVPSGTGLISSSRSIQMRVFDGVVGVSLSIPSVALEGKSVSINCTWTAGTETSVQWGKGGSALNPDSRISISAGSLVINPARRGDAGEYTCTVRNPVSAGTATGSLTVYYGPDTPVLTKSTPAECVGGGDAVLGQTVRLTCVSDSLPPALFSWQHDEQPVASGQPDSGVLSVQTFSTNQSGRYVCVARNAITGGTSEQGTDLAIVGICLSGGAVAGIVIACVVALILIIVAIVLLVRWRSIDRRLRDSERFQKTNPDPRLIPPDPQTHHARDLGQGPHPPLHDINTHTRRPNHFYTAPHEGHGNSRTPQLNGLNNSNTRQHNGRTHANGLPHNTTQNTNSFPHIGIDNPAFTHTVPQNVNALQQTQQQNPDILMQSGTAQGGGQPPTVQVNLNTQPQTAQQNNNAQLPTVNVNLNSYPTNSQPTQQSFSPNGAQQVSTTLPLTNTANHSALQNSSEQNLRPTGQSHINPRMQTGLSNPDNSQQNGHIDTQHTQAHAGLIPTGYTHFNRHNTAQRNARTQTYERDQIRNTRSGHSNPPDTNSVPRDSTASADPHRRQMPWDRRRGTPSYPNDTGQRGQTSPDSTSDSTDYTTQQSRSHQRTLPGAQSQTSLWSRAAPRRAAPSVGRQTQTYPSSLGTSLHGQSTRNTTQPEAAHHTHGSPHTQRESSHRDIRGLSQSQTASRQAAAHSNSPQALPLSSQQLSVDHAVAPPGPAAQQGPATPWGSDTRALADPNHLPQAHVAQQHRAPQIQTAPQGLGIQTQPGIQSANHPRQGAPAQVPFPSAQPDPNNLTQSALQMHTQRAQAFQNRNQQTQAALFHPRPQAHATIPGTQHAPAPPPVIPLTQFQALPKERNHHTSPTRDPHPPRPPVNVPMAQRHPHVHQHPNMHRHPATMQTNPHRHPGNAHVHANGHRNGNANGRGHPAHPTHPRQAHRERPRW